MNFARLHNALNLLRIPFLWQPLTFRGAAALLLGSASLYFLAFPQKDLVAATLGGGLLALTFFTLLASLLLRFRIAPRLEIEARFDRENAISRAPIDAGLVLNGSSVPPYFSLRFLREFEHKGVISPEHIVRGAETPGAPRHLIDSIVCPHRGLWRLSGIRVTLEDSLGFCRLQWRIQAKESIEVKAPTIAIQALPVVAASSRAGDQLDKSRERSGDPFDLKPYDPSDGIRRILWKTYAKSGELVVRRPEPAIIPEGEVAIYLIAGKDDDVVAGALQHYLSYLYRQQIDVLFGTDGLHAHSDSDEGNADASYFCTAENEVQKAINRNVWHEQTASGDDFRGFIEEIINSNRVLRSVIVFAPADSSSSTGNAWFQKLLTAASDHSIKLSIALVQKELEQGYHLETKQKRGAEFPFGKKLRQFAERAPLLREHFSPGPEDLRTSSLPAAVTNSGSELHMVQPYES